MQGTGQEPGRVEDGDVGAGGQDVAEHVLGLGAVRGAGHVGDYAAGAGRVDGRVEQGALEAAEVLDVFG